MIPTWEVWSEGYMATGEHGTAQCFGRVMAMTFEDACAMVYRKRGGRKALGDYTPGTDGRPPMFWGCRLYDNEADARRSYG